MSDRLFVLGAGRAGRGLTRALREAGFAIVGLHGRRAEAWDPPITGGPLPPGIAQATIILVAVRDGQIEEAFTELAGAPLDPDAVVLHASGIAEPLGAALRTRGHAIGTFHPLLPLVDADRAGQALRGAWVGIDGDARAREASRRLAERLGARLLDIPSGGKVRYHAAAVYASNFPVVLAALAERLLTDSGTDAGIAHDAVLSLMAASIENFRGRPPSEALTGPVMRGDVETVRRHLATLATRSDTFGVYVGLSRVAANLAAERGADPERLEQVRALLLDVRAR